MEYVFATSVDDRSVEIAADQDEARKAFNNFVKRLKISHSDNAVQTFHYQLNSQFFERVDKYDAYPSIHENLIQFWSSVDCLLKSFDPGESDIDEELLNKILSEMQKVGKMKSDAIDEGSQVSTSSQMEKPASTVDYHRKVENENCRNPATNSHVVPSTNNASQLELRSEQDIQTKINNASEALERTLKHLSAEKFRKKIKITCSRNTSESTGTEEIRDEGIDNGYKEFIHFLNSSESERTAQELRNRINNGANGNMDINIVYNILLFYWIKIHQLIKNRLMPTSADCDRAILMTIFNLLHESFNLSYSVRLMFQASSRMKLNSDFERIFQKENILQEKPSKYNPNRLAYHKFVQTLDERFLKKDVEEFIDQMHRNVEREENVVLRRIHLFIFWTKVYCILEDKILSGACEFEKGIFIKILNLLDDNFMEKDHLNYLKQSPQKLEVLKKKRCKECSRTTPSNEAVLQQLAEFILIGFPQSAGSDGSLEKFWNWIGQQPEEKQVESAITLLVTFWASVHCLIDVKSHLDESTSCENHTFQSKDIKFYSELLEEIMNVMKETYSGNSCVVSFYHSIPNYVCLNWILNVACYLMKQYYTCIFKRSVCWRRNCHKYMSAVDCCAYKICIILIVSCYAAASVAAIIALYDKLFN